MNKQEAIKKVEQMGEYEHFVDEPISKAGVFNILNQLDESEKVKVPKFAADWIEEAKTTGYNIKGALVNAPKGIISDWLELYNVEVFAAAWVNGYTIEPEKEKRYKVVMPNISSTEGVLTRIKHNDSWIWIDTLGTIVEGRTHTRKELEEAGFGWVFDCEGVEVEEVE